jgi:type II secretory pathway component GspD/PulD (secretin)
MKTKFVNLLIAISAAAATAADQAASVRLDFPNADVNEVLALYDSLTHFKLIRDNFVQGKITVAVTEPVTPEKAIEIIERTLFADGFAIIQIDPDTVQIVGAPRNPRHDGAPTVSDPNDLPKQERLISYFFQFRYADADKVLRTFSQYLSPPKPYTFFARPPGVNALWVTERSSVIRELITAAEKIDVPQQEAGKP